MRVCATNKKLTQAHLNDAPSRRRDLLLDATSLSSFGFPSLSTYTLSSMVTRRRLLRYRLPMRLPNVWHYNCISTHKRQISKPLREEDICKVVSLLRYLTCGLSGVNHANVSVFHLTGFSETAPDDAWSVPYAILFFLL
ncbi:hypothetical protein TNCT_577831 [Trichonephila clavata]|uniref:Uncharacterized protein n=1 Tax=Trichonephila clavata TaxID=2740835 RepID=A0A8X6GAX4_TRICU|nr:hypothetical protein TNCT_577831 [Trichonephila clavata]